MNKSVKIGILATFILTLFAGLTGFFERLFEYHIGILFSINDGFLTLGLGTSGLNASDFISGFQLNSAFLMLGMSLSMISAFVEKRKNAWFYGSILIIIIGILTGVVIRSYEIPAQILGVAQAYDLESFWIDFSSTLYANLFASFYVVLTSPLIITPYILISRLTADFYYLLDIIVFNGFKGVILIIGHLHIYPEFYAFFLVITASIRITLKSFKSYFSIRREGFKNTFKTIKNAMEHEIRNTMPQVVILLIIAALLETLWTPFWINYCLGHIM